MGDMPIVTLPCAKWFRRECTKCFEGLRIRGLSLLRGVRENFTEEMVCRMMKRSLMVGGIPQRTILWRSRDIQSLDNDE